VAPDELSGPGIRGGSAARTG